MEADKPLVDEEYRLEKFPGKGGWTFAAIPQILPNKTGPFGWMKVRGNIDDFPIKNYKLMPMGNDRLFLPVKAEIRKKIGKKAGDIVKVVLYADETPLEIPEEIGECFANEPPQVLATYLNFTEGERKAYLDWIYNAKRTETKAERIASMMGRLIQNKKLPDK
jgi:hypothetical protein